MAKVVTVGNQAFIAIDNEIVTLGAPGEYGDRPTPVGYARLINGVPCTCTVAWVLPDNGNCPCAPNDDSNPVCKACPKWEDKSNG
jgi:hypothetical protein